MHFGENQLSPGSLGISPLPTAPPTALQRGTVRASSGLSPRLTLAMGSSPGFGPARRDHHALLGLACAPAPGIVPLNHAAPGQLAGSFFNRHAVSLRLRRLVGTRFQGLFHSPPGVLFTVPSRYSFTIGQHRYLALERGRPSFPRNSTCSAVLRCPTRGCSHAITGLSPSLARRPRRFILRATC